jgi:hypothetical protein
MNLGILGMLSTMAEGKLHHFPLFNAYWDFSKMSRSAKILPLEGDSEETKFVFKNNPLNCEIYRVQNFFMNL